MSIFQSDSGQSLSVRKLHFHLKFRHHKCVNYLGQLDGLARPQIDDVPVGSARDTTLVERHDVLRERARLVREDVLNLAELLVQRRRARLGVRFRLLVVHLLVPVDQERLREAYHLKKSVKRLLF